MTHFTLFPAKDYLEDLTHSVRHARTSIYIMDLIIADDEATHTLIAELEKAAQRGVRVDIAADLFTYGELGGFFSPFKHRATESRAVTAMTKRFIEAGINFRWLGGNHKFNPFSGVTHIKWCTIDDIVYCFGGTNLYKKGIESADYMFKTKQQDLAKNIMQEHLSIITADASPGDYAGFQKPYPYGTLLIDSGKRGDSLIYTRATALAEKAQKILVVSQYCPSGSLIKHLKTKNAALYFNRPEQATFLNRLLIQSTMLRTQLKTLYRRPQYIHAKFILFEMPNGEKISLTGSHNFTYSGVSLGTREVALETHDPAVYEQLESFWRLTIQ